MARGRLTTSRGGYSVVVDPDPKEIARDIGRYINKPMKRELGKLHRRLGEKPAEETRKKARALGSGRIHIARTVKPSATQNAVQLRATGPDIKGQEYGSKRYGQFLPFEPGGYVLGAVQRDREFMERFAGDYLEGIEDLLKKVWGGRG